MFLEPAEVKMADGETAFESKRSKLFLTLLAVPNVILVFYWEPIIGIARGAISIFVGD
jgi:hypothetical protein